MRYFTWKLDWSTGEGVGPTRTTNSPDVTLEPIFSTGDLTDPNTLVYGRAVRGEIIPRNLTKWQVTEVSETEALTAAKAVNPEADLVNEEIRFPIPETPVKQ